MPALAMTDHGNVFGAYDFVNQAKAAGVEPIVVYGGDGKLLAGAPWSPTKTMFQFEPLQLPICELRVRNCCWDPDRICPSTLVSEMKPPLDQPPSSSARLPRTCMRRYGAACETAQRSRPPVGVTERFSAERQKFCVAFCEPSGHQSASACTAPLMFTASGVRPRPATWV